MCVACSDKVASDPFASAFSVSCEMLLAVRMDRTRMLSVVCLVQPCSAELAIVVACRLKIWTQMSRAARCETEISREKVFTADY